jgi:hypothetical protein
VFTQQCARMRSSPRLRPHLDYGVVTMRTIFLVLLLSIAATAQTQTTRCQGTTIEVPAGQGTYTTGQANCTTVTTPPPVSSVTTQQAYEAGQDLGRGIASIRARHWVNKFCKKHPGQSWWYRNPAAGIDARGVCFSGGVAPGATRTEAEADSWHTQFYCEKDGFVWRNGGCHADPQTASVAQGRTNDQLQSGDRRADPCPCVGPLNEATCRANWASVCQSK